MGSYCVIGHRYCTFRVAGLLVGIEIARVVEVLREQTVTPVPLAHPDVAGLLNLRGQVLTAIDARTRLGLAPRSSSSPTTLDVVVTICADESVCLLVDGIGDVVDVPDEALDQVPDNVAPQIVALIVGVHQLDGELLLLLDPDLTLAVVS
jgi:purine-binding chemotaxis protein CheW